MSEKLTAHEFLSRMAYDVTGDIDLNEGVGRERLALAIGIANFEAMDRIADALEKIANRGLPVVGVIDDTAMGRELLSKLVNEEVNEHLKPVCDKLDGVLDILRTEEDAKESNRA